MMSALRGALDDPDVLARTREAYALVDAAPNDPRVAETARALAEAIRRTLKILTGEGS